MLTMSEKRIGRYALIEKIGVGAVSNIYRARDSQTGRMVAMKDVLVEDRDEEKYLRHVRNEYKVLTHVWNALAETNGGPGFVQPYELIKSGLLSREKRLSFVMQYIVGRDLRAENRYPLGQMVHIFVQIAETLARIHSVGYVHADMKPENVMVGPNGKVTLVDFGFACKDGTRAVSIRGTREYMAPEQVQMGLITAQTDVYNFGATMYYLLTERHIPALITNPGETMYMSTLKLRPRDITDANPSVPMRLARLVVDCCQSEPVMRCTSAGIVVEVLKGILRGFSA